MGNLFNTSTLFASMLWGALGSGIFMFGWKQKSNIPIAGGVLMTAASYFVGSALLMSVVGVAIIAGMYWAKKQGY